MGERGSCMPGGDGNGMEDNSCFGADKLAVPCDCVLICWWLLRSLLADCCRWDCHDSPHIGGGRRRASGCHWTSEIGASAAE